MVFSVFTMIRGLRAVPLLLAALGVVAVSAPAFAADDTARKVPRFVSLNKDEIFVRTGPSLQYPIRWVYKKRGLPVEVVREYDTWRQIKDFDGAVGWVHHAMLSGYRSGIVKGKDGVTLTARPDSTASVVVRLEKGVVVGIDECADAWCRVRISGFKGWVPRVALWGVYPDEQID
jgi:SH3-like domain-containing protein